MTAFCFFGVRHVTHVQTSGETDERSFFECDEIHATTKRDEATVSARWGARVSPARFRAFTASVFAIEAMRLGRALGRGDRGGLRQLRIRRKVRDAVRDEGGFSSEAPRPVARGRRCRGTYLGAAEAETALELGVNHAATAGDVLLVVGDVLVHALPAGHLDLHAVALAELGGGGAELVARDAADRADLRRWSGFGFGESECQRRRGDRARRARRSRKAPRRRAGVVTRGIFFSLQRPKAE